MCSANDIDLDHIICPIVNEEISDVDCMEVWSASCRILKDDCIDEKFKSRPDWRSFCETCKYNF